MTHADERQLTAWALGLPCGGTEQHVAGCPECQKLAQQIKSVVALATAAPVPAPPADLAGQVWRRLQAEADQAATSKPWVQPPRLWRAWALAASLALAAGFLWMARPRPASPRLVAGSAAAASAAAPPQVLLDAVSQHLDRTQALLTEVVHAAPPGTAHGLVDLAAQQASARSLLASNRLYQLDAMQRHDPAVAELLGNLEPALMEIIHTPSKAQPRAWRQLRARITQSGLLFQMEVMNQSLRTQVQDRNPPQILDGTL